MAKKGMKRIDRTHTKPRNELNPVPEIQGKAKHGKTNAGPISSTEKPISKAYSVIDTDVARDNLENDLSKADLQDL